jgi:hypothetical protein
MPDSSPFLDVRVGGLKRSVSELQGVLNRSARLDLPEDFPLSGLRRAQIDLEIVSEKLRENADDVQALLQAFIAGRNSDVERLISQLGVRESDFEERGGGIFWAVVVVGVLCCASEAY